MRVLIYSQSVNTETLEYIKVCINELEKYNAKLYITDCFNKINNNKIKISFQNKNYKKISKTNKIDFLICFGGDGTM